jgi:hypothetical protein
MATTKVWTVERPYLMVTGGAWFPLSSEDAQRLVDASTVVTATSQRVVLDGGTALHPATLGGGPAFVVERRR